MDYHVHPNYSIDAQQHSIDMFCNRAVELNLAEICFTPHFECDPVRRQKDWFVRLNGVIHPMECWQWIDCYFEEIERARVKYTPLGLKVKAGVEIGYDLGLESTIERLVNSYPFDYILGSVHCLNHCAISNRVESGSYFAGKTVEQVIQDYYYLIEQMVKTKLFDCVGHIDLYRRYGLQYLGPEIELVRRDVVEPILKKISQFNMGLEINTSSRRRGHREFHPGSQLLNLAIKCGVKIFTLGSDAHGLSQLGEGISEAWSMLKGLGQDITVYSGRKPRAVS
ncbi:histidinol-phosphatase (PHP family) [Desulfohalotomaculum tongense]|uniref:histidinol-phosphatase n=1 Tax=Desulforadius tongensis TaxID=1216062 RepID=UPI003084276B|nr:histidinol-phosphatase (PHP family) [Desulforadius tongensis]